MYERTCYERSPVSIQSFKINFFKLMYAIPFLSCIHTYVLDFKYTYVQTQHDLD